MIKASTIKTALEKIESADMPAAVNDWQVQVGQDSTNDLAIWVWAILQNDDVNLQDREKLREIIRQRINNEFGHEESTPWIYVRFRTDSEITLR